MTQKIAKRFVPSILNPQSSVLDSVLITGGNGQIAWDLQKALKQASATVTALSREELDITQQDSIERQFNTKKPSLLINCAAYTAVDKAEEAIDESYRINRDGALYLAESCMKHRVPLIHLSTDYVFDGNKPAPYLEIDEPHPLSQYGKSKLAGEEAIRKTLDQHMILRVSGVFGFHGNNFVKTMARLMKEKEELRVVSDQITCPTPAADIADVILNLAHAIPSNPNIWGTYHYCSTPPTSWYHFALAIMEIARQGLPVATQKIIPVLSSDWKSAAKRPMNAVFNCDKIRKTFQINQKPWKIQLEKILRALC